MTVPLKDSRFIQQMKVQLKKDKKVNFEGDDEPSAQSEAEEALLIINDPSVTQFIADDGSVYLFSNVPKKSKRT